MFTCSTFQTGDTFTFKTVHFHFTERQYPLFARQWQFHVLSKCVGIAYDRFRLAAPKLKIFFVTQSCWTWTFGWIGPFHYQSIRSIN